MPTEAYAPDPNRVAVDPGAETIWKAIRKDKPLPGTKVPSSTTTATAAPTTTEPALTVSPDKIQVRVSNDSGIPGLAKQSAAELQVQGFKVASYITGTQDAATGWSSATGRDRRRRRARSLPSTRAHRCARTSCLGSTIELSMGVDSPQGGGDPQPARHQPLPKPSVTATPSTGSTETIKARTAAQDICS